MTELGLIVGIDVVGLVLALLMWRWVSVRDAGPVVMRRLGGALERATRAFLWRQYRSVALFGAVLVVLSLVLSARAELVSPVSRWGQAFGVALGLCLGALGAALSGYVSAVLSVRASVRTAAAAAHGVDAALRVAMRASGSAALFSEALSGISVTTLFALAFAVEGGFKSSLTETLPLVKQLVLLLPSFAVGAAVSALVLQRGGGAFHAASGVGSDQAGEREAGLDHDDARNPAVIAELVGDHVGASATRIVDGFAGASIANVGAMLIGATLSAVAAPHEPLLLVFLPLVVRAFGVVASGFAVLLVRHEEAELLGPALVRGYSSLAAISLAALGGTSYWLFGPHFLPVFGAGALGLLSVLCAAHALLLRLGRRNGGLRETTEALRLGSVAVVASGLGTGLQAVFAPVALLGLSATFSVVLGVQSGMPAGGAVCLLMFVVAALSVAPFVISIALLGSIADGARGVASVSNADGELKRGAGRLEEGSFASAAVARHYAGLSGALSSLLVAWAILSPDASAAQASLSLAEYSTVIWCGALGASVVLGYAGSVARAAIRGGREIAAEVERQLRGFPREHGLLQVPRDYTPSYKSCVELTTSVALRRTLLPIATALAVPVLLGVTLHVLSPHLALELATRGLGWFVVVATITGLTLNLAADSARATLGRFRRANRGRDSGSAFHTAITADAWSDIFGNAAAPALQMLVKATAAAALIIAPRLL